MKKTKKSTHSRSLLLAALAAGTLLLTSIVIGLAATQTNTDTRSQASERVQPGPIVYRLIHEQNGNVLLSTNKDEINRAIKEYSYRFQQAAFRSVSANTPGAAPVYRLHNTNTDTHAYAIDPRHRRELVKLGFKVEGAIFHAFYPQGTQETLLTRFYNPQTKKYDWRLSDDTNRPGYERDGGAFRVINIGWPR